MELLIITGVVAVGCLVAMIVAVMRHLEVVGPGEVAVISCDLDGEEGRHDGYRLVTDGRFVRAPSVMRVDWMDTTRFDLCVEIDDCQTKDRDSVALSVDVGVDFQSSDRELRRAVEFFLGRPRQQISKAIETVVESNTRAVGGVLTAKQLKESGGDVATRIADSVELEMEELGFVLQGLHLSSVKV